jgi:hypothetical protein
MVPDDEIATIEEKVKKPRTKEERADEKDEKELMEEQIDTRRGRF